MTSVTARTIFELFICVATRENWLFTRIEASNQITTRAPPMATIAPPTASTAPKRAWRSRRHSPEPS